jgi:cyclin H
MAAEIGVKTTKEDLLAPEINIAMNLRWAFHVLHPYRGVEGLKLELYAIALGTYKAPPVAPDVPGPTAAQAQARLFKSVEENGGGKSVGSVIERIESVCGKARLLLTGPALFTDVYFLYTPSQITLAGLWCLDRALAEFLIDIKFSHNQRVREKLLHVVKQCAERHLLVTLDSPNHYPGLLLRLPQNGVPMGVDVTPEIHQEVTPISFPSLISIQLNLPPGCPHRQKTLPLKKAIERCKTQASSK